MGPEAQTPPAGSKVPMPSRKRPTAGAASYKYPSAREQLERAELHGGSFNTGDKLVAELQQLDSKVVLRVIAHTLQARPDIARDVVWACVPELTRIRALENRHHGNIQPWNEKGFGFIACPG